jgi:hypothetical protein
MPTLTESIESAIGEVDKVEGNEPETNKSNLGKTERTERKDDSPRTGNDETPDENGEEGEEEESKSSESDLSDEEIANAKNLFKALKDPNQAPQLVKFLAEQAGYVKPETKVEAREQAKDIITKLKESAGEELGFLIDKIGPVIKEELESQVNSVRNELRADQVNRENAKIVEDTKVAIKDLATKYYDKPEFPNDVYKDMTGLMDKLKPSENMSPAEYIEMLYFTVAGKKGISLNPKQSRRVERNRDDVPSRIASQRGVKTAEVPPIPKKMDLNESIRTAIEQIEKGEG